MNTFLLVVLNMKVTSVLEAVAVVILFRRADGKDFHEAEREVASCLNDFGWKIYNELSETPGNLLFSPLSLNSGLAMLWEGARGRTADEIADVLGLPLNAKTISRGYQQLMRDLNKRQITASVKIANKLFSNSNTQIKSAYKNYVKRFFLSEIQEVHFDSNETVNSINKWVEIKTNNNIKNIIDSLGPDTSMIMVNALYFKGIWSSPFHATDSYLGDFKVTNTLRKEVAFMGQSSRFGYAENDDLQFLKMDYEDGFSMVVILPKQVDGLRHLEDVLIKTKWNEIEDAIQPMKVSVKFPKFTIESKFQLVPPLQKMGLNSLFEEEADLSGIADSSRYVSAVVQKTFINVTETGTGTGPTGTTGGKAVFTSLQSIPEFIADHPFIFVLRHQGSGVNLFIGRVLEP